MRINLMISFFDEVGGSEEQLTVLAGRLKEQGHAVTVFTKMPVNRKSQYVQRLIQNKIKIVAPSEWIAQLLGNWYFQDKIVKLMGTIAIPFLFPVAFLLSIARKKPLAVSMSSAVGFFRSKMGAVFYRDRLEQFLIAALNFWTIFKRPDVLHVFRFDLHPFLRWADQKRIPSVYYELITPNNNSLRAVDTKNVVIANINKATLIHAISKSTAETLRNEWGITRPIDVVYPFLKDIPAEVDFNEQVVHSPLTVTCIARLSPEKGIGDLMLAAKSIFSKQPDVNFLVAGSGPLKETLVLQANDLGISDRFIFYGSFPRSDLGKIMARTDIFVLPSYLEGLPFVIIEAMAYRKPVVATNVGGVIEIVDDGVTGIIVPPREPECLSDALLRLVEDSALRHEMGYAGWQKVRTGDFSVDTFINHVLAGYKKVTGTVDDLSING